MATSTGRKPATGPWSTPCTGAAPMSSKIECTAVNELIDLVQQKPLDRDSAAELLFQPPREANLRRQVDGTPAPRSLWAVELPEPTEARATMPKIPARGPQFEPTPRPSATEHLRGGSDIHAMLKRLAVPAGILVMVGIGSGAAIKLTRHHATGAPLDYVAAFTPAHHRQDEDGISALAAMSTTKAKAAKDGKPSDAPGFLSITTSVPCAILVDGANTGKTSPAKLSVPAGHHSVRLIAATQHINKQISVDVAAKKTTKLFQSF